MPVRVSRLGGIRDTLRVLRALKRILKANTFPFLLGRWFAVAMIAVDHRTIGAGGDHEYAAQPKFHQKYFEPLLAVRTIILGLVAVLHGHVPKGSHAITDAGDCLLNPIRLALSASRGTAPKFLRVVVLSVESGSLHWRRFDVRS